MFVCACARGRARGKKGRDMMLMDDEWSRRTTTCLEWELCSQVVLKERKRLKTTKEVCVFENITIVSI